MPRTASPMRSRPPTTRCSRSTSSTASLPASTPTNASDAALMDQRDSYIDQLSELMDIRVVTDDRNQVNIFTNSGIQLVGAGAAQLAFDAAGHGHARRRSGTPIRPRATLGTLMLVSAERRRRRSDRQQVDPLGQDRRLSRHARQRPGAGAEPARQPRRRRWRRRCRTTPSTAPPSRPARRPVFDVDTVGLAERQPHQPDLHRHADQHAAQVSIVRVDDPAALPLTTARRPIRTTR